MRRFAVAAFILLSTCGPEPDPDIEVRPEPQPPPRTGDPTADPWLALKPIVERACGGCHNGEKHPLDLRKKASFDQAKERVRERVEGGTMPPPPARLAAADKSAILAY